MNFRVSLIALAMVFVMGMAGANAYAAGPAAGIGEPDAALIDQVVKSSGEEILLAGYSRFFYRCYYREPCHFGRSCRYRDRCFHGDGYRAAKRRCALRYDSYDWYLDTIITRRGNEKLCPYVRPYY